MATYVVTGKLGAGKSILAVDKIREYLAQGRRVATNMDIFLEHLMLPESKKIITRIPDRPRREDLDFLGRGHDEPKYNEKSNGLLVLDECLAWLNTRNWQDKSRAQIIDWFIHARKKRWDLLLLVQNPDAIDRQLFDSICEHLVEVNRLDRMKVGPIKLPRVHIGHVYYGSSSSGGVKVGKWITRDNGLFEAYDTEQAFLDGMEMLNDKFVDMRAPYTILSAWHIKGRYLPKAPSWVDRANWLYKRLLLAALCVSSFITGRTQYDLATAWGVLEQPHLGRVGPQGQPGRSGTCL